MKKLLVFTMILGSSVVAIPSVQARALPAAMEADPQIRVQIGQQRRGRLNNRRTRTVTERDSRGSGGIDIVKRYALPIFRMVEHEHRLFAGSAWAGHGKFTS